MGFTVGCMPCSSANRVNNRAHTAQPSSGWWLWSRNPLAVVLWPVSLIFCGLVYLRRLLYQRGVLASNRLPVPVVVVGNISLGGSGKTPVVNMLVKWLQAEGYQPAILTRGYKSDLGDEYQLLAKGETSEQVGDEANMLSETNTCPLAVGADRVAAGQALLQQFPWVNVLVCDDGLQHYALQRDVEVIVKRDHALGNRWCLPAGPLREPLERLSACDLLIDRDADTLQEYMRSCWNLAQPEMTRPLADFAGHQVYALAGIGFPDLFFQGLRDAGLEVEAMAFADHHEFIADDLPPDDGVPLLVTHKDAVKLRRFERRDVWVVVLELELPNDLQYRFLRLVESAFHG